jgi:glutathione S-transferase
MITLIHFPSAFGLPDPSPFCMKAEILLKMAGVAYTSDRKSDPRIGSKGKLPMLVEDGHKIPDSTHIQQWLQQKCKLDFDAGLTPRDRAIAHAAARMCEERLYWCLVYSRWINPENWPKIRQNFFSDLPPVIRTLIPVLAQRKVRAALYGHGLGRHSASEIYAFAAQDIAALAALLGDQPFMMGATPTSLDAIAYPILASMQVPELATPLMTAVTSHPALVSYCTRAKALWYPDFK